jgi:hypothetical protein
METKEIKYNENKSIRRAIVEPAPADVVEYDFKCVASPIDNGQLNYSYETQEFFNQVLMPTPENTRVARLDSGLNLFDNHTYDKSAKNTLGISTKYEFTERGLELYIKLGARADEALRSDIKNRILKTVSIEGDIYEYTVNRNTQSYPNYEATDWEPISISIAPVPQDILSQIELEAKRSLIKTIPTKEKTKYEQLTNKF